MQNVKMEQIDFKSMEELTKKQNTFLNAVFDYIFGKLVNSE